MEILLIFTVASYAENINLPREEKLTPVKLIHLVSTWNKVLAKIGLKRRRIQLAGNVIMKSGM